MMHGGTSMIRPTLPPRRGHTEISLNGRRMYLNSKTGAVSRAIVGEASTQPSANTESDVWDELAEAYREGVNAVDE